MSDNPVSGYTGFENPDQQYYGTNPTLPVLFTGAYQIRQFGAGGFTLGAPVTVLNALASPPTAMTTASEAAINDTVATAHDIFAYYPSSTTNPNA